jgi:aldehyde dehydrogenase (NAD+)
MGAALASHLKIQKINFTGSTAVGKVISQLALKGNMKDVALELGEKIAAIVFTDSDIPNAVGS